ncbi:uncharacterized protein LOC121729460 [Aricia agestis]|uniref:uncharacterized protein LOC121729460 n=1 Tax=Aricia agestis TaxID=91739 RepID=UPI001C206302|nr:uncharacterized protein LOC121729460 [Aricia agestis]
MYMIRILRPLQYQYFLNFRDIRLISHHTQRFSEVEERYRQRDGMSRRWNLIYKAPMEGTLKYTSSYLTFSTVSVALGSLYYAAFMFDPLTMNDPVVVGDNVVIVSDITEAGIYLGAFFLFHTAIKVLLSKYVVRMYKDGDNYVAIFNGHWHNQIKKHKFHLNEFEKLNPTYVVTWGDARYGLGKKHGILLDNYFKTPEYLNILLYKRKTDPEDE